jgi:hypothetical protein
MNIVVANTKNRRQFPFYSKGILKGRTRPKVDSIHYVESFRKKEQTPNAQYKLSELNKEIEKSKYILDLKDNWYDEGSVGYDKITWEKSIEFVINYANWISENFSKIINTPKIYHGPKGGIDILWERENYKMLVHIDKEGVNGLFYADNNDGQISEGQFHVQNTNFNLLPLTTLR